MTNALAASAVRRILQVSGWLLILAVLALSFVPASFRPVTPMPHGLEHLAIWLATGMAFGLGYQHRWWLQAVGLVAFAGAVEIAQMWVPTRHARDMDFVNNAGGALLGIVLAIVILWLTQAAGTSTRRRSRKTK